MKPINIYRGIALLAITLVATACQSELNQPAETAPATGEKVTLTIRATQGGTDSNNTPQTRTTYTDGLSDDGTTGNIFVKWEDTGEAIEVWGYNNTDIVPNTKDKTILEETSNLSADGKSITFTGEVPKKDNYAAFYPTRGWLWFEDIISYYFSERTQDCALGNEMKHLKYSDIMLGTPRTPGTTDDFSFRHLAVMLRFDLQLPADQAESITSIELLCDNEIIYKCVSIELKDQKPSVSNTSLKNSITFHIMNHTAANTLKAYMMLANIDLTQAQTLTIGVSTASGNSYISSLTTTAGTTLQPGHCYTLRPTLAKVDRTLTVTGLKVGKLHETLSALTDTQMFGKTKLVLSGAVSNEEFAKKGEYSPLIKLFLNKHPFTEVDLSQVTELTDTGVDAFLNCNNLTNVTLPSALTILGESAFYGCTKLTTITVPASVTSIGNSAFYYCSALQSIFFEGTKAVGFDLTLGSNLINGSPANLTIFLPNITNEAVAKSYQPAFKDRKVYYNYNKGDYNNAPPAQKVDVDNYTIYPTNQ